MKSKRFLFLLAGLIFLINTTCSTNPLTGRKSLSWVSNSNLFPQSFTQYKQVLSNSQVDKTSKDAKMIQDVGERIKYAAERFYTEIGKIEDLKGYKWEFSLIKNDQVNAWCMPGGKVAFYTGILPICKGENGIAVVMGHEVAHALAGHSAEQVSNAMLAQGIMVGGGAVISNENWRGIFNQLYPVGAGLTILKYGREMELDADKAGLYLMAMAGYNPQEAVSFWKRMEEASKGGGKTPQFLSTHPDNGNRIKQIQQIMPKAMEYYNSSPYKGR